MRELVLEGAIFKKRRNKKLILMSADILLMAMSYGLALIFRYYIEGTTFSSTLIVMNQFSLQILLSIVVLVLCQWMMKQYQSVWTVAGVEDFTMGALAVMGGTVINLVISNFLPNRLPFLVTMLAGLLSLMACNGIRLQWRIMRRAMSSRTQILHGNPDRLLIYGAGMAGAMVAKEYRQHPHLNKKVIAFIDDDKEKMGTYVGTIPVLGTRDDLEELVQKYQINEVIVAIANIDQDTLKSVFASMNRLGIGVKIMPGLFELIDGKLNVGMIKDVKIEDLKSPERIRNSGCVIKRSRVKKLLSASGPTNNGGCRCFSS